MDKDGHLRYLTDEEVAQSPELIDHPVEDVSDIPDWKLAIFRKIDKAGNRKARQKMCKKLKASWSEYQIYVAIKTLEKSDVSGHHMLAEVFKKEMINLVERKPK